MNTLYSLLLGSLNSKFFKQNNYKQFFAIIAQLSPMLATVYHATATATYKGVREGVFHFRYAVTHVGKPSCIL